MDASPEGRSPKPQTRKPRGPSDQVQPPLTPCAPTVNSRREFEEFRSSLGTQRCGGAGLWGPDVQGYRACGVWAVRRVPGAALWWGGGEHALGLQEAAPTGHGRGHVYTSPTMADRSHEAIRLLGRDERAVLPLSEVTHSIPRAAPLTWVPSQGTTLRGKPHGAPFSQNL